MNKLEQHEPQPSQQSTYLDRLTTSLQNVPELQPGLELMAANPEQANGIYKGYSSLIASMTTLSDLDKVHIRKAKAQLIEANGSFGTASQVSADDLLNELGDNKSTLAVLASGSTDIRSPYFTPALDELVRRMEGGHQLKLSGKQPSDDDPESRLVIWGHTMLSDPIVLIHFMSCHYLERYFAVALNDQGSRLASQKDFLLNALIDVVLIDHQGHKTFNDIYTMWRDPKQEGGLGWITDDRYASYQ